VTRTGLRAAYRDTRHPTRVTRCAFSLVEILVVITLLSLIVVALMAVFNTAQTAFRASVTQTDVLEGGRATMDMMTADLRRMTPSFGYGKQPVKSGAQGGQVVTNSVNFYASVNPGYSPLMQSLPGSSQLRTNVLENFFILSRENRTWTGVGYVVQTNPPAGGFCSLYRFSMSANLTADPWWLFYNFTNTVASPSRAWTNWSHLLDGVVDLTVRAYDTNGVWMTNGYAFGYTNTANTNIFFFQRATWGEVGFYMFSNALPASVEIELGVLEDRALRRAATWPNGSALQNNYLTNQAGAVHIFRQRVNISNVDPSAYQQ